MDSTGINAMNDHFYAQIEIYTLNIIIVIHVCKFKFAQIWNRLQRSFWEPGIKLTLNLAWRFCGNKCPIVYWVKVLGDQNLTYAVICDSSIDVLLQVSNTASCEPLVLSVSNIWQLEFHQLFNVHSLSIEIHGLI